MDSTGAFREVEGRVTYSGVSVRRSKLLWCEEAEPVCEHCLDYGEWIAKDGGS